MIQGSPVAGELLRICRGPMSQTALAKGLRIDRSYVSKVESGDVTPSQDIVNAWVEFTKPYWMQMYLNALTYNAMMAAAEKTQEQMVM